MGWLSIETLVPLLSINQSSSPTCARQVSLEAYLDAVAQRQVAGHGQHDDVDAQHDQKVCQVRQRERQGACAVAWGAIRACGVVVAAVAGEP